MTTFYLDASVGVHAFQRTPKAAARLAEVAAMLGLKAVNPVV